MIMFVIYIRTSEENSAKQWSIMKHESYFQEQNSCIRLEGYQQLVSIKNICLKYCLIKKYKLFSCTSCVWLWWGPRQTNRLIEKIYQVFKKIITPFDLLAYKGESFRLIVLLTMLLNKLDYSWECIGLQCISLYLCHIRKSRLRIRLLKWERPNSMHKISIYLTPTWKKITFFLKRLKITVA